MERFPVQEEVGDVVLVYDVAKPHEAAELAQFMLDHYFCSPPVRQIYFWDELPPSKIFWALSEVIPCLMDPVSLVVREKRTGQPVGLLANKLQVRNSPSEGLDDPLDRTPGWLARAIIAELNKGVDLFDQYGTDRILEFYAGAIRSDCRHLRIGTSMVRLSEDLAASAGAGAIKLEAFSRFAGSHPLNKVIKSVDYAMFEYNGTRPLERVDMGVHKSARLLARPVGGGLALVGKL